MRFILLALCSIFILSCHHTAAVSVKTDTTAVETTKTTHALTLELMDKCGINEQIGNVPEKTKAEVLECFKRNESILGKISDQVVEEINGIIGRSFNPDIIRAMLAEHIEKTLSPSDMLAVITWLDSPLGLKLTAIEKIASTPEAYREMIEFIPLVKQSPDYEERLQLVHEIDTSVKATELIVDRMLNMQIITISAMASAFPDMDLPSEQLIRADFEKNRKDISQAIAREIALSIFFTYRNISKEEIREYIRFMKTDHGVRYHDVIQEGSNKAYTFCGKKFSEAVVKRIKDRESSSDTARTEPPVMQYPQAQ